MTTSQIDAWLEKGRTLSDGTKMSDERLDAVFQLVNPGRHGQPSWKYPIDAYVSKSVATAEEIEKAVIWFAGGVPSIVEDDGGNDFHVTGAGYYEWAGA